MRFSIVTPSYNQAEFVEATMESVLGQTYRSFEYIVVDGGSTDGTQEILHEFNDAIDKLIIEPDDGQADAINKGFKYASGEILAYLNSDDYYFKNTLALVEEYFKEHPEVDMIYGDCVFTDENGQFIRYFSEISDFDADRLLNFSDHIMQPAAFWRKSVFEKYGPFNIDFHYGFDWAFWCELAKNGCRIERVPSVLAANRVYSATKTLSGSGERLKELKCINQQYGTRWLNHAYYSYVLADIKKSDHRSLLDWFLFPFLIILSYGNILHHFRNFNRKIILGFMPKSSYVMKNASIKIPRLNYQSICIQMNAKSEINQKVTVYSNGELVNQYAFCKGELDLELPLIGAGDVDIFLVFESEFSQFNNLISQTLLFYKPKYVAAEITSITMA